MARPIKYNVDYFPHYISNGKKMSVLQSRYGNNGYAVWFKILEQLAQTDFHYLDLNNSLDLHYLANNVCLVGEDVLLKILNDLAEFGEINSELWAFKIVWSEKFMISISDAYKRRECKTKDLTGLLQHINDTKPKLAGLLHTLIPKKGKDTGLLHIETAEIDALSTERERERERERENKGIEKENVSPEKPSSPSIDSKDFKTKLLHVNDLKEELKKERFISSHQLEAKRLGIDFDTYFLAIDTFTESIVNDDNKPSFKTMDDYRQHLKHWLNIMIQKGDLQSRIINSDSSNTDFKDNSKPAHDGENGDLIGKWLWRNGKWRDTTTFTKDQKEKHGLT